jgi:hypothetical protein
MIFESVTKRGGLLALFLAAGLLPVLTTPAAGQTGQGTGARFVFQQQADKPAVVVVVDDPPNQTDSLKQLESELRKKRAEIHALEAKLEEVRARQAAVGRGALRGTPPDEPQPKLGGLLRELQELAQAKGGPQEITLRLVDGKWVIVRQGEQGRAVEIKPVEIRLAPVQPIPLTVPFEIKLPRVEAVPGKGRGGDDGRMEKLEKKVEDLERMIREMQRRDQPGGNRRGSGGGGVPKGGDRDGR